jgi:hypothetical protein
MITDRSVYTLEPSCCGVRPSISTLPEKCPLQRILESKAGATLGLCYRVVERAPPPAHFENQELSMIRLIHYCNHNRSSRGFLDGLLDLLSEEVHKRESLIFPSQSAGILYPKRLWKYMGVDVSAQLPI